MGRLERYTATPKNEVHNLGDYNKKTEFGICLGWLAFWRLFFGSSAAAETDFAAFSFAGIAGKETVFAEDWPMVLVGFDQGSGDAMFDGV